MASYFRLKGQREQKEVAEGAALALAEVGFRDWWGSAWGMAVCHGGCEAMPTSAWPSSSYGCR